MKTITDIINDLQSAANSGNAGLFAENFIAYEEFRKTSRNATLYQFGINPAKETTKAIANITTQNREDAILKRAEEYIKGVDLKGTHKERKEKIESALYLLIGLYKSSKEKLQPQTFILIARAYLLRSLIIRPKGRTVPEKKKECLKKGSTFINNAMSASATLDPSEKEEAHRVQCLLLIELNRIDEKQQSETTLKGILKKAITNGCNKFDKNEEDVRIAIRYSEIKPIDTTYLLEIVAPSSKGSYLEKAKAFYLLNDTDNLKRYLSKAIRNLRWMKFSYPQWDEMVCFLKMLKDGEHVFWKEFSVKAWQACQIQERWTPPIHLRWHWSRQRDLYDLAFLAVVLKKDTHTQHDYKLMAKICDSQKSRTSLRWSSIDDMVKETRNEEPTIKELRKFLESEKEAYALSMMGGYSKGMMDITERMRVLHEQYRKTFRKQQSQQRGITDVPNGWIVIHFYLNKLEDKGYALIFNADTNVWEIRRFSYHKLFEAFLAWQSNYNLYKEQAANHLVRLCEEIGNAMPFLFKNDVVPRDKDVLFIPHDFLHRLPLHGAITQDENGKVVFLENHPCCYLPVWTFVSDFKKSDVNGYMLLNNFPKYKDGGYDFNKLRSIKKWHSDSKMDNASPEDLKTIYPSPELLVILCHGKADAINPFNARLELTNGGITHIEILSSVKNIKGSRIILGACETDLVPPLSDAIDEHLSITTAFLTNGVIEILGTMWKVDAEKTVEEVVEQIITEGVKNKPIFQIINSWQIEKLNLWKKKDFKSYIYYDFITLRTYGKECVHIV